MAAKKSLKVQLPTDAHLDSCNTSFLPNLAVRISFIYFREPLLIYCGGKDTILNNFQTRVWANMVHSNLEKNVFFICSGLFTTSRASLQQMPVVKRVLSIV